MWLLVSQIPITASLFSRHKWAVMKRYEPSLQGMGVSTQADVMACLHLLPHPLCRAITWWNAENDAFPWKSTAYWLSLRCDTFTAYGQCIFSIQATLIHFFQVHRERSYMHSFMNEGYVWSCLTDWYHTSSISLRAFNATHSWRESEPSSGACDFLHVHTLFEW